MAPDTLLDDPRAGRAARRPAAFTAALLRLGVRNATRHRLRNGLLAVSIGTAAALLVIAASVGRGIREQLVRRIVTVESGAVTVALRDAALALPADSLAALADHAVGALRALPGVRDVRGRVSLRGLLLVAGRSENVQIKGVAPAREPELRDGYLPDARAVAAAPPGAVAIGVSDAVARGLRAAPGAACLLVAPTRRGSMSVADCVIARVYPTASRATGGWVYADLPDVATLYDVPRPTELLVDVDDLSRAEPVLAAARDALAPERAARRLAITGYRSRTGLASGIARANGAYMLGLVACVLLIAATGLATAVINGVRERQAELGTLLALGWSGRALLALVLAETVAISLPAALCGAALGATAAAVAGHVAIDVGEAASIAFGLRLLRPSVPPSAALAAVAACTALPLGFAWLAARRVAALQPVRALQAS